MNIKYYELDTIEDLLLEFAVVAAKYNNSWIYCKHKDRETFEMPGGHREKNETIIETAKRELFEESGAISTVLIPVAILYGASSKNTKERFGMLYYADIEEIKELPNSEIERIELFEKVPENLTYPSMYPELMDRVLLEVVQSIYK